MKSYLMSAVLAAAFIMSVGSYAQAPAGAPAGTTGLCKDGTYYDGQRKKGACADHKGLKDWYGSAEKPAKPAAAPAAATPAAAAPAAATNATSKKTVAADTPATPAAGGGPGKVWVNAASKVYHCPDSKWYGTTKKGEYMTEAAAKAAGNHADHGKACS